MTEFIRTYNTEQLHGYVVYTTPLDKLNGKEEEIIKACDFNLEPALAARKY